ncbi:Acyl-CoA N-acyltransferase [Penicillium robsamsonii]|uniref:Acyl-CoA N-acyltransferase n=1 Tax=Penicillium robsamsonii TaxID=1792511 RepID=UPI0025497DE3|nr:Acyl-CoA N-acyltransferase [Penicillium robsamsonii]KAJ5817833.1 Acyl-CoA N-acyltransferase [Penicillium robsamsonii]
MELKFTSSVAKYLQKKSHLFVIIYENEDEDDNNDNEPIGTLFLQSSHRYMAHNRCSKLGIGILNRFRLHEAEAVNWALDWGSNSRGLHRVEMNIPSWNMRVSLCDELGFRTDGKRRECYY